MRDDGRTDPGTSRSRSLRSDFHLLDEQIVAETALDGIYAIRTGVPKTQMSAADAVSNYTALANVERAFRSFKTDDLKARPIHHRPEGVALATAPRR